jgi:inner membrane protein
VQGIGLNRQVLSWSMLDLSPYLNRCQNSITRASCLLMDAVLGYPFVAVAIILGLDALLQRGVSLWEVSGMLDEPAHLLTAALLLAATPRRFSPLFTVSALASSILIDLDHIPIYAGWQALIAAAPRPYTHSLATVVAATCLACAVSRRYSPAFWGVAVGVSLHFVRDLATGQVPLFWPVSSAGVVLPYPAYVVICLAAAVIVTYRQTQPAASASVEHRGRGWRTVESRN